MNLHEYQARELLSQHGVPVPPGEVAASAEQAEAAAACIGGQVVVKAQVHSGGRGKAGGVKLAGGPAEAREAAEQILGTAIRGLPVHQVLVAPAADIRREIYVSFVLDRAEKTVSLIASAEGGVDIEEVAATSPESIVRAHADPLLGFQPWQAREVAFRLGLGGAHVRQFADIAMKLYEVFTENDASLVEVNPLAEVGSGELQALDAKVTLDDNGLFRHRHLAALRDTSQEDPSEVRAAQAGINYVKLDGEIGCMVNGAGLAMATMDMVKLYGGEPANFLDIGGGATAEQVTAALNIILSDPNVKAVLINIFGGIARCDVVAHGIVEALEHVERRVPMVVRLEGTNAEEGRRILENAHLHSAVSLSEVAELAVRLVTGDASAPKELPVSTSEA
ncbi:MAG: ADP-forming succinate--CoA ligase subunit beta [Chloroflexota bacterium]|nr:ADP-forming succinate--CoA ligase subunit beta [Chloroflexota bacterium]